MKRFVLIAAALIAAPAAAQDHSAHAAPAPAAAPAATAVKFSLDTPIEALMADPKAKAAVEAGAPGMATHESYDMFKAMSLNQLAPMAPDKLTPEVLAKIGAGLAAIK